MNWHEALKLAVKQYESRPVMWGISDCCQFAATYWKHMTGENLAADFDYQDKLEAGRILVTYDGMEGLLEYLLGEPGTLKPGAVVLTVVDDDTYAPGVYTGYCVWAFHPDEGLCRFTTHDIRKAWPCPQ